MEGDGKRHHQGPLEGRGIEAKVKHLRKALAKSESNLTIIRSSLAETKANIVMMRVNLELERPKREVEAVVAKERVEQEVEVAIKKYKGIVDFDIDMA